VSGAYTKWKGTCDEIQEITQEQVQIPAYAGTPTTRIEAPRGMCGINCRWKFATVPTSTSEITTGTLSVVNFEGYECPYGKSNTVGFYGSINLAINSSVTSLLVGMTSGAVAAGMYFTSPDMIRIDNEIMLVTSATAVVSNEQTLTVIRGYFGTTAVSHTLSSDVRFADCDKSVDGCKRRGMYGNNPLDTF
jgi:hypothetical protein